VGVVLVHEIMGRDAYAESVAGDLSREGYHVVAVDLYSGRLAKELVEARAIRDSLRDDEVRGNISDAWHILRERYGSASRTGIMGFCMGGGIALQAACEMDFDLCIDYYGMMQDVEKVKGLNGPLTLFLGAEDHRVTPWAIDSLVPAMRRYGKLVEVHVFPNAGHAFHRPGWPGHEPTAAKAAWARTLDILKGVSEEARGLGSRA